MTSPHAAFWSTIALLGLVGPTSAASAKPQSTVIRVSMTDPSVSAPAPIEVDDGADVRLAISKNLLQQCTVENKATEIKAEPNALGLILGAATRFFGLAGALPVDPGGPDVCDLAAEKPPRDDADATAIELILKDIALRQRAFRLNLAAYERGGANSADAVSAETVKLTRCLAQSVDGKTDAYVCADMATFGKARDRVVKRVRTFLEQTPVPGVEGLTLALEAVKKAMASRIPARVDEFWLPNALRRIDCYGAQLDNLNERRKGLVAAREQLRAFAAAATMFQPAEGERTEQIVPLRGFRSTLATVTVSCINYFTKQPTVSLPAKPDQKIDPLVLSIVFQSPARLAASGGLIYSSIGKLQYGPQPVKTGVDAAGVNTFVLKVAETDRSATQTVPFFFLHGRLFGARPVYVYATGGVGLNANNGSKQVEYFAGATLGGKGVYVGAGVHFGRVQNLTGDFKVGDLIPDKLIPPVTRQYRGRRAVTISYKLPLP